MALGLFSTGLTRVPGLRSYGAGVGLAGVAVLGRALLEPFWPALPVLLMVWPMMVLSGVFCGTGPAVVTAVVGAVGSTMILSGLLPASWAGLAVGAWPDASSPLTILLVYVPAGATMLWATHSLRRVAVKAAAAEERLAEVFRHIPGAAAILQAPDGKLLLRSRQSDEVLGHPAKTEAAGAAPAPPLDHYGAARLDHYGAIRGDGSRLAAGDYPIMRALQQGELVRGERLTYRQPGGKLVELEVYAGPVRGADGGIRAAVGMAFDVSERVAAERRLAESEARYREMTEQLGAALAARELLMREADHRIKNSLQLVVAVLQLQQGRVADGAAKTALDEAITRVGAVAEAHLALQDSPDLRSLDIDQSLEDLCRRVGMLNPSVTITCAAATGLWLDAEQAIPLGLIASELLTNALRHAYPAGQEGVVRLSLRAVGGYGDAVSLCMTVADDGIGMAEGQVPKGLGSTVIAALARQIGAMIDIESDAGSGHASRGTRVSVGLTLAPAAQVGGSVPASAVGV
jgi:two-component sensor histidine kinase